MGNNAPEHAEPVELELAKAIRLLYQSVSEVGLWVSAPVSGAPGAGAGRWRRRRSSRPT
jgi:hypothetical protein